MGCGGLGWDVVGEVGEVGDWVGQGEFGGELRSG